MTPYPKLSNTIEHADPNDPAAILGRVGGDPEEFVRVLANLVKARGVPNVAEKAGIGRESLYKTLNSANPRFKTVSRILGALGLRLSVVSVFDPSDNETRLQPRDDPGSTSQPFCRQQSSAPDKDAIDAGAQLDWVPSSGLATKSDLYAGGITWVDSTFKESQPAKKGGPKVEAVIHFLATKFPQGRPALTVLELVKKFEAETKTIGVSESTFNRAITKLWR